ncbi:MAG: ParB/RepB/Spo0J family partition protein [Candidatus Nitrospinota bacterium M3_3B_026]
MKRQALGKGLSALIPEKEKTPEGDTVTEIPVEMITPSRFQPRTVFNEESLAELAGSIRERGVIQPIIVTRRRGGYELIAGERRWRAVRSLGYEKIPAIVKIVRDSEALEMAIVENIQRDNLNPIEEAGAYERLMREFAFTQEDLSRKIGRSRSAVANSLRLLRLPEPIKDDLAAGALTMGHARALLSLSSDEERLAMRDGIVNAGLNVRDVEGSVKARSRKKPRRASSRDVHLEKLALSLERKLEARVEIKPKARRGGVIQIHYTDVDDLNRIVEGM